MRNTQMRELNHTTHNTHTHKHTLLAFLGCKSQTQLKVILFEQLCFQLFSLLFHNIQYKIYHLVYDIKINKIKMDNIPITNSSICLCSRQPQVVPQIFE